VWCGCEGRCVDVWYAEAINQEKLLLPWDLKDLDLWNLLLDCLFVAVCLCVFIRACVP
jgi:hypothetical protein